MKTFWEIRESINATKKITEEEGSVGKHKGVQLYNFPKKLKPHPKVVAQAQKDKENSSIEHVPLKGGHHLQAHGHDDGDYIHYHHIDDKGNRKGTYTYNVPHNKRLGPPLRVDHKAVKKSLPNSGSDVHKAVRVR